MQGKVAIVGASTNRGRYAWLAAELLDQYGFDFVPLGIKKGQVFDRTILDIRDKPQVEDIDTLTMYMNAMHQEPYLDYLISLKPRRIIFNPGAENNRLASLAAEQGIETLHACTLVMLRIGNFDQ